MNVWFQLSPKYLPDIQGRKILDYTLKTSLEFWVVTEATSSREIP
ncbi:hypothetical protein BH23BAC2_BH23BAC2_07510 [soil metagenome]